MPREPSFPTPSPTGLNYGQKHQATSTSALLHHQPMSPPAAPRVIQQFHPPLLARSWGEVTAQWSLRFTSSNSVDLQPGFLLPPPLPGLRTPVSNEVRTHGLPVERGSELEPIPPELIQGRARVALLRQVMSLLPTRVRSVSPAHTQLSRPLPIELTMHRNARRSVCHKLALPSSAAPSNPSPLSSPVLCPSSAASRCSAASW